MDARGVGRRALLKRMGKGVMKAKFGHKEVVFGEAGDQGAVTNGPVMQSPVGLQPPPLPPRQATSGRSRSPSPAAVPPPLPPREKPIKF